MSFVNKPLTDIMDCTRDSTATYVDATGKIRTAGVNEPRIDYSSGQGRLLVEEQRTNLLTNSENLDSWSKTNTAVLQNQVVAPDGTLTADKLVALDDALSVIRRVNRGVTFIVGSVYTFTVFVKAAEYSIVRMESGNPGGATVFNLATKQVLSQSTTHTTVSISEEGSGWFRCSVTFTATATNGVFFLYGQPTSNSSFIGDGTSGIYIWGAQVEEASTPSSYIPTAASAVTRAADIVSRVLGDEFNNDEFSLFAEGWAVIPRSGTSSSLGVLTSANGTTAELANLRINSSAFVLEYRSNNEFLSSSGIPHSLPPDSTQYLKMIISGNKDRAFLVVNGVKSSDYVGGVVPTFSEVYIGARRATGLGGDKKQVAITKFKVYPKALSEQECIQLTKV